MWAAASRTHACTVHIPTQGTIAHLREIASQCPLRKKLHASPIEATSATCPPVVADGFCFTSKSWVGFVCACVCVLRWPIGFLHRLPAFGFRLCSTSAGGYASTYEFSCSFHYNLQLLRARQAYPATAYVVTAPR